MDIIGVHLVPDVDSLATTNIGICLVPQGQIQELKLKDLKNIIMKEISACPKRFNFCTEQRWTISEEQEDKLLTSQILMKNNEILIKVKHDGLKCGVKNRHGNVIGFVHVDYDTKLITLKHLICQQILNSESPNSIHFLDGNSWPISSFQEDHMAVSDILIGYCICIDVQTKRQLSIEQFTPPKEPPVKKLRGSKELSFSSGKDVCRQLSSDCTDGTCTAKQILISYVRSEAAQHALRLKQQLISHGLSVYLDVHEIQTGVDWQDSLNFAVSGCEVFVPLVTTKYGETQWTNREVKLADVLGKYILPISFLNDWPPRCLAIQFATTQYIPWKTSVINTSTVTDSLHWKDEDIGIVAKKISDRVKGLGVKSVPSLVKRSTIVRSCALVTEDKLLAVTSNRDGKPLVMICVHPLQEEFGLKLQGILEDEDYEVWCTTQLDKDHLDHIDGLANSQDDITYSVLNNSCSLNVAAGYDDNILKNIQIFQEKADEASVVLFLLCENFSGSRVCQQQVFYCEHRKRVVPIMCEDFQMPEWMTMLVGSHGFEMRKDEDFIKILLRRVKAAVVPNLSGSYTGTSPSRLSSNTVNGLPTSPPLNGSKMSVTQQNSGKFTPRENSKEFYESMDNNSRTLVSYSGNGRKFANQDIGARKIIIEDGNKSCTRSQTSPKITEMLPLKMSPTSKDESPPSLSRMKTVILNSDT
ncbi:hypothetical protein ACF0H5_009678 [Mactra antiquata]